jgi:putative spermidine/putrescine transport system ATP-binding protein
VLGRAGTFAVRPERILVLNPADTAPPGMHRVDATVAEVVYAGPITRVATRSAGGVALTASLLSAEASGTLEHGTPVVLAWPESAVRDLST